MTSSIMRSCQNPGSRSSSCGRSEEHTSELQSHSDLHSFPTRRSSDLSLLSGLLSLRLFVIYHDQQHHAILPKSRLAEFFMRIFGIWALSPSSIWRSSHDHHHKHNSKLRGSHIGSFPIMTKAQYWKSSKAQRFEYLFMRHPLTILFGYPIVFLYGMCLSPF